MCFGKNGVVENEIEQRKTGYIFYNNKLLTNLTFRDFCDKHHLANPENEHNPSAQHDGAIQGHVAFAGSASGTVRIINTTDDIAKVNQGDILVSVMTNANYLPTMKKAAAIVTDEGGITCHAAIVARELNIPCIIGTKTATSILQNGDMVSVDAHNGTVEIIKNE